MLKQSITLLLVSEASLTGSCLLIDIWNHDTPGIVLTCGADIFAMGLNVTHQVGVSVTNNSAA